MIVRIRLGLLIAGIVAFTVALNTGTAWLRWVAMACVGVALLLRFVPRK